MPHERYHHGDLRRALLDAAMALIEENGGPHGWSLREAARRAGVSPGAPYRHFEDKQALLVALGVEGLERLNALCAEEAAARGVHALDLTRVEPVTPPASPIRSPSSGPWASPRCASPRTTRSITGS